MSQSPRSAAPQIERIQSVRINAPEWFLRPDFIDFLHGRRPHQTGRPASWHQGTGEPTEFSDVFVTFDHSEGSDAEDIPEDIWAEITRICSAERVEYGVVWISPVG